MAIKQPIAIQDNESLAPASIAFENAIRSWADATTSIESARRHDLLQEKTKAVATFFCFLKKSPESVVPGISTFDRLFEDLKSIEFLNIVTPGSDDVKCHHQ